MTVCHADRPAAQESRSLELVQAWAAPSGRGELFIERHADHAHLWWRWRGNWNAAPTRPDWAHFAECVYPVVIDLLAATPLDLGSLSLLEGCAA